MTGGEYHTDNFILHMHKCLSGLEVDKPQAKDVFDYDDMTHAKIVGKLTAPSGLGYLEAFRREKNLPGGVRKAAVVAPYEVAVAGRDQLDALTPQVPEITKIINRSYGPWPTKAARTSSWMPPFSGPKSTWA
jgi:hypothetical protein